MKHQDIVKLVKSMEVRNLTKDTFDSFARSANGLFVPRGARFQEFHSPGFNELTKKKYDFSEGKPEYRAGDILVYDRMESREIPEEGKRWIDVYFQNKVYDFEDVGVWGFRPNRQLPLMFGFAKKALYIAEQEGNGTPEHPWETVYLKI